MKLMKYIYFIATVTLIGSTCPRSGNLALVLGSTEHRAAFAGFLDNVLRQMPSSDFYTLVDHICTTQSPSSDDELYCALLKELNARKSHFAPIKQLKALSFQKELLAQQACSLIGSIERPIDGCVEIGTPGTYTDSITKSGVVITGSLYAVLDQQRFADRFQAHSSNPRKAFKRYDAFVPLNNYEPLSDSIPSQSVDMVICFIGLHHVPLDKLEAFVASISRVLRPGGRFILRDHDCSTQSVVTTADVAHTVFNAIIPSEALERENAEIRNFQPMKYWVSLLDQHRLGAHDGYALQEGDPSCNMMKVFTKRAVTEDERLAQISYEAIHVDGYVRDKSQTYMTSPEWVNVDIAQDYGNFIAHTPFYEYPYINSLRTYWKVWHSSLRVAARSKGYTKALCSSYTLMNGFIGATMTAEYLAKAFISLPVRLVFSGAEATTIQAIIDDPMEKAGRVDSVEVLATLPGSGYKRIALPRYGRLLSTIEKLSDAGAHLKEIAGQRVVALTVEGKASDYSKLSSIPGCAFEYDWQDPAGTKLFAVVSIEIRKIMEVISNLKARGITVVRIHDF